MEHEDQGRGHTEGPHAAATPMMTRARKWTARCPAVGVLPATVMFCSVLVSFFGLVLLVSLICLISIVLAF